MTESAAAVPPAATLQHDGSLRCPNCRAEVAAQEAFCEACGIALTPTAAGAADESDAMAAPIEITRSIQTDAGDQDTVVVTRPCANCGGVIGADGYCETCGTKAPTERDHYTEHPAAMGCRLLRPRRTASPQRGRHGSRRRADTGYPSGAGGLRWGVHVHRLRCRQLGGRSDGA